MAAPACGLVLYSSLMNRFLKTMLLWLLIALVPLQAVAATMGVSCGLAHQQAMANALSAPAHHDMSAPADHHHGDAHAAAADQTGAADTPAGKTPHSTCSACSAFCVGAVAPPSPSVFLPSFSGAETLLISAAPLVAGFIPDGRERPPRLPF